jgi:phage shock protein A
VGVTLSRQPDTMEAARVRALAAERTAQMANPFVKGWRYLMALFGAKIDEYADPKVQIQQAIEEAQRQHQALVQQAAAVIGNQRQLEMKLSRQMSEVEKLQASARQALVLADKERASGDEAKAAEYERTAQVFATQLVAAEQGMEDLKTLHDQSLAAATQARKAVENNAMILQQKIAERTKLLSQLEQAKMQETVARSLESMSTLAAPGNTPSLDEVREKIERRYANAMGRAELASNSVEGRMLEVQKSTLDMAGSTRLEQIRASMAGEQLAAAPEKPAVAAGPAEAAVGPVQRDASVARLDELRASMKDKAAGDSAQNAG